MLGIEFHLQAEAEMVEAAAYYEQQSVDLGFDFLNEVENGVRRTRELPHSWAFYDGEYRRYLLRRFPYGLVYRVDSEKVFVIAVAHLRRSPGYWMNRA